MITHDVLAESAGIAQVIPPDPDIKRIIILILVRWLDMTPEQRNVFMGAVAFYTSPPMFVHPGGLP